MLVTYDEEGALGGRSHRTWTRPKLLAGGVKDMVLGLELEPEVASDSDQIVAPVPSWIRIEHVTSDWVFPSYTMIST